MDTKATTPQDNISVRFKTTQFTTISATVVIREPGRTSNMGGNKIVVGDTYQPIFDYLYLNQR